MDGVPILDLLGWASNDISSQTAQCLNEITGKCYVIRCNHSNQQCLIKQ